jgi:hypothetical protein
MRSASARDTMKTLPRRSSPRTLTAARLTRRRESQNRKRSNQTKKRGTKRPQTSPEPTQGGETVAVAVVETHELDPLPEVGVCAAD